MLWLESKARRWARLAVTSDTAKFKSRNNSTGSITDSREAELKQVMVAEVKGIFWAKVSAPGTSPVWSFKEMNS